MAARPYYIRLRAFCLAVGRRMGTDLEALPKPQRVAVLAVLYALAVLIDLLVSQGHITNAQLTSGYDLAEGDTQDDEPNLP